MNKNRIHEYGYVDQKGYFHRNIYKPYEEIQEVSRGKVDQYYSIFSYGTVKGHLGALYAPFYLDIDKENDLEGSYTAMQNVLEMMGAYGVDEHDRSVYFSGKKGFHVEVAPEVFSISPMIDLEKIYKQIALLYANELEFGVIDMVVYERKRLWRVPNTINSKSGLYKIQITGQELLSDILKQAEQPSKLWNWAPKTNEVYKTWISRARVQMQKDEQERKEYLERLDKQYGKEGIGTYTQTNLDNGVGQGGRDNEAFRIACYLRDRDFSIDEIESKLILFGKRCRPPLSEKTILDKIRSAFKKR